MCHRAGLREGSVFSRTEYPLPRAAFAQSLGSGKTVARFSATGNADVGPREAQARGGPDARPGRGGGAIPPGRRREPCPRHRSMVKRSKPEGAGPSWRILRSVTEPR